jgi:alpha-L-fucosidase
VRELLTQYGPICLVWFDTPQMMDVGDRAKRFTDLVRTLQPDCLIDGRLGAVGDYHSTSDNVIPKAFSDAAWETPATINHTWGYRKDDNDWKRPGEIIFKLVDIVSKGGNYLLNIGPMADGVIPERSVEHLRTVGAWLKRNGESIYGASRTPFGDELGGWIADQKDRNGKPVWGERNELRITTKPGKLYFTAFPEWPRTGLDVPKMKNAVRRAYFLDDAAKTPLEMKTGPDGTVNFVVPRPTRQSLPVVICVEFDGEKVERS